MYTAGVGSGLSAANQFFPLRAWAAGCSLVFAKSYVSWWMMMKSASQTSQMRWETPKATGIPMADPEIMQNPRVTSLVSFIAVVLIIVFHQQGRHC